MSNPSHPTPNVILIDGSSYLYRAFHALPQLTTGNGQTTGAIKGVMAMLFKLLKDYPAKYIAVVFDAPGKTFRHQLYTEYKAHRPPMPVELSSQIAPLEQLIQALGIKLIKRSGVEADDVLGTLAKQAAQQELFTLLVTGDKDMAQLVGSHIALLNTMKDEYLDTQGVEDKLGITPAQVIDYLALMGDSSDNIPGVPKVGPKTAVNWLKQYGSIKQLTAQADSIKGKIGDNLRACLDQLALSQQLATIKTDVQLPLAVTDLTLAQADKTKLIELYRELEFSAWLEELVKESQLDDTESTATAGEIILTQQQWQEWLAKLQQAELIVLDTETTGLNYMTAQLVGIAFAVSPDQAAYLPLAHDYPGAPEQLKLKEVLEQLKPLLEDETKSKIGQNLKYDSNILANYDIQLKGIAFDTMLESYVLNPSASRHNMDSLALKYLGKRTIHFEDIAGKGSKQLSFNQIPLQQAGPYAIEDVQITLELHQCLYPQLKKHESLVELLTALEMPLVPVLAQMERTGALLDSTRLTEQSQLLAKRILKLEQQAHQLAGQVFNLNSAKQLQEIFYQKLQLPVLKKTPKGQPSTAEQVLQDLALDYPLPKLILEHRQLTKLKTTYTDKLPQQVNHQTQRIHTSYHQAVVATGRLSSSDPNLQNIPIRTEEGRKIRQAFIAPSGYKLVAADYSQIELRIMAHLTQDPGLLRAFHDQLDIHQATAAEVFAVPLEQVTSEQRRSAKAINFGLIYGMSAFGLSRQLGIPRNMAQNYMDRYFQRYPKIQAYMQATRQQASDQGYVTTLWGRRLYLPDIKASNLARRRAAERAAINAPMQGTAADIIKRAMLAVDRWLVKQQSQARMILQVHDELVLEVPVAELDKVCQGLQQAMAQAANLSVPLEVAIGVGDNWDQAH
jgi:DNA polymerase-1